MQYRFIIVYILLSSVCFGQSNYTIKAYDKNTDKEARITDITISPEELCFNYGGRFITLDLKKNKLEFNFVYVYIDTIENTNNCVVIFKERDHSGATSTNSCNDINGNKHYHIVRNLPCRDYSPKSEFRLNDFTNRNAIYDDFLLNADFGYGYSSPVIGSTLKYYRVTGYGYGAAIIYAEYAKVISNHYNGGEEFGVGIRLMPPFIGLNLNAFVFNETISYNLRPEIGLEFGNLSLFYGINLSLLNKCDLNLANRHYIKLSYGLNMTRPIKNLRKKYSFY